MSSYRCSEHDTHQNGCSTCEVAKDYYDKDALIEQLTEERDELARKYEDLILEVVNVIPDETRHETAKRIIRQWENQDNPPEAAA